MYQGSSKVGSALQQAAAKCSLALCNIVALLLSSPTGKVVMVGSLVQLCLGIWEPSLTCMLSSVSILWSKSSLHSSNELSAGSEG